MSREHVSRAAPGLVTFWYGEKAVHFVTSAGSKAPKNAPAFSRATMFEDVFAVFEVLPVKLNSLEKLPHVRFFKLEVIVSTSYLPRATTEPATPVSNPKRSEPVLATAAANTAPLCFLKRAIVLAISSLSVLEKLKRWKR